jgi:photosystem II stability/assembly factor-like uncharacterized protein
MMHCPHCNQEHPTDSQFCPLTGKKIIRQEGCPQCGQPVEPGWQHCPACGRKLTQAAGDIGPQEPKTRVAPRAPGQTPRSAKANRGSPILGWLIIFTGAGCSLLILAAVVGIAFWLRASPVGGVSPRKRAGAIPAVWSSNGPEGGNIRTLAIDPSNPDTLYAGTWGQGVFKSTDGGASWSAASNGLTDDSTLTIHTLTIDPVTPTTLYAGTSGSIFKSTDGGGNWSELTTGLPEMYTASSLAIDPAKPTILYLGASSNGIFKSTDGGENWSALNAGLTGTYVACLAIDPASPTTLYLGTYEGLLKSTDGGENWRVITSPSFGSVLALVIDPQTLTTLYVGTGNGVFKSTDSGESWSAAQTGLPDSDIHILAIDPVTPTTLYSVVTKSSSDLYSVKEKPLGIFKSTDGGLNWSAVNGGLTTNKITSVVINPATPTNLYVGTESGVFKSTDGAGNWSAANSGLTAIVVTSLVIDPAALATLYAGAGVSGVFKSTDGGESCSAANSGLEAGYVSVLVMDPATPTTLYALGASGFPHNFLPEESCGVFKSIDGGESWSAASTGLTSTGLSNSISLTRRYLSALVIDPLTPTTLFVGAGRDGVFKSTNGGESWNAASNGLPEVDIRILAIDPLTPTTLYAGGFQGGVFKSTDGGENWNADNNGLPDGIIVSSLTIDPLTPTTLYAGIFPGDVFKSTDGGLNWSELNTGLPYSLQNILAIIPARQTTLYVVRTNNFEFNYYGEDSLGVFISTDSGASWSEISTNLTHLFVFTLAVDPAAPDILYLGTSRGVFKGTISGGN